MRSLFNAFGWVGAGLPTHLFEAFDPSVHPEDLARSSGDADDDSVQALPHHFYL